MGLVEPYRRDYSAEDCSIARTLESVGEKWTLLILRESFFGVRRFEDIQRGVGCARNLLSARLGKLVEQGILRREPYREPGRRQRYEYRLTDKGRELFPIVIALMDWGDRWATAPGGPPDEDSHRGCDAPVHADLSCAHGHTGLTARDTYPVVGEAARLAG
jgi:DNA-binding HxlR family transcriptional regulator